METEVNRDDPMDLGPFLQSYVLNQPNILDGAIAGLPCPPVELPTTLVTPSVELEKCAPAAENGKSPGSTEETDVDEFCVMEQESGQVIDTPKAHIGSNLKYAMTLRDCTLPPRHREVQKWLLLEYRFIAKNYYYASDNLLREVKEYFHNISSGVLSRIMKFTFPKSRKIINKYGYFYEGLIKKPVVSRAQSKSLHAAMEAVQSASMSIPAALELFKVPKDKLNQLLLWDAASPGIIKENAALATNVPDNSENGSSSKLTPGGSNNSQQTVLKWKLRKRCIANRFPFSYSSTLAPKPRLRPRLRPRGLLTSPTRSDTDRTNTGQPCSRLSKSDTQAHLNVLDEKEARLMVPESIKLQQLKEEPSDSVDIDAEQEMADMNAGVTSKSVGMLTPDGTGADVQVKIEPIDSGFVTVGEQSSARGTHSEINKRIKEKLGKCGAQLALTPVNGQSSKHRQTTNRLSPYARLSLPKECISADPAWTPEVHSQEMAKNSVVHTSPNGDSQQILDQLDHLSTALQDSEIENKTLRACLQRSKAEIQHYKDKLTNQQSQFCQMAEEMVQLSNQFSMLSKRFQQVISSCPQQENF